MQVQCAGVNSFRVILAILCYFRVLPSRCNCTGGNRLWTHHSTNGSERWCEGQKNSCIALNGRWTTYFFNQAAFFIFAEKPVLVALCSDHWSKVDEWVKRHSLDDWEMHFTGESWHQQQINIYLYHKERKK